MTRNDVDNLFAEFERCKKKPTLKHVLFEADGNTVAHAEIWADKSLVWKFPKDSEVLIKEQEFGAYGPDYKAFSLRGRGVDIELQEMGRKGTINR